MVGFCFYWSIGQVIPQAPPTESDQSVSKPAQLLGCQRVELIKKNDFLLDSLDILYEVGGERL